MIRSDDRGEAVWITIDRPSKKNAITNDGWRQLIAALERAESEARVAVLTGEGDAFSAGDDIQTVADMETIEDAQRLADGLYHGLFGIESLEIPVIAAVNGLAYGGGFELVAAADIAVASEGAVFAIPETRIGAYPPYAMARIGALVGKKRLMELAMTGADIDASTAHEWGLVNEVVTDPELEPTVSDYVEQIAAAPETAISLVKRYAHVSLANGHESQHVRGGFSQLANDTECRERAQEFLDG